MFARYYYDDQKKDDGMGKVYGKKLWPLSLKEMPSCRREENIIMYTNRMVRCGSSFCTDNAVGA
jgi:hypothetical protein